jgi:hypothetical protein
MATVEQDEGKRKHLNTIQMLFGVSSRLYLGLDSIHLYLTSWYYNFLFLCNIVPKHI